MGESIARALGRNGLSNPNPSQRTPSALGQGMVQALPSQAAATMRKLHRGRQLRRAAKLAAAAGTAGTATAATVGTKALASQVVSRTAAKTASAGTSAAAGALEAPARRVPQALPASARGVETLQSEPERMAPSAESTQREAEAVRGMETGASADQGDKAPEVHRTFVAGPGAGPQGALAGGAVEPRPATTGTTGDQDAGGRQQTVGGAPVPMAGTNQPAPATVPAPPQRKPAAPQGARTSNLPPGRYGTVWVHANGTSTTVLTGPNSPVPSQRKVNQVWDISSPEVPVARSQKQTAARQAVSAAAQRVNRQDEGPHGASQRLPRPMRKAGE